ncbi:MAG TPA: flavodoxin domain-containing protein [Mycobacteriales bacterium]|nr:flavodoxin domain-containing protein [Mycobacteriales bacterium]
MKVVVVYESMFGNTRRVAEAIRDGLCRHHEVEVLSAAQAPAHDLAGTALLVVGGPTHVRSMSRPSTRKAASEQAADASRGLTLEPQAAGPGLREWLAEARLAGVPVAAFDTRIAMPAVISGSAVRSITRALHRQGGRFVCTRRSFLVTKQNTLVDGQLDLARQWGEQLAETVTRTGEFVE